MQEATPQTPGSAPPGAAVAEAGPGAGRATDGARTGWQGRLLVAGVVVAAAVALLWPRGPGGTSTPGGFLVDPQGRPSPLGEHLTPVTLVHFWATWCPPCLDEIPVLQRLAADFSSRPGFSVAMIAVDDDPRQVRAFLGGDDSRILYDPQWEVAKRFGTEALPETYLLVGGEVAEKYVGATDWSDPAVRRDLERALARSR